MDQREDPDDRVDTDLLGESGEPGSSRADVLTMCLFGAMVLIASVCFVIW